MHKEIFILGAGASVCCGLPTWNGLEKLVINKLEDIIATEEALIIGGDSNRSEKYLLRGGDHQFLTDKKDILLAIKWIKKIGAKDDFQYRTIDDCIATEINIGKSKMLCEKISSLIFYIIEGIFNEKIIQLEGINSNINHIASQLIKYLIGNNMMFGNKIEEFISHKIFIDFNYDNVLPTLLDEAFNTITESTDFGNFRHSLAHRGIRIEPDEYKTIISYIVEKKLNLIYKPHGSFRPHKNIVRRSTYVDMLNNDASQSNCISCHRAEKGEFCFQEISTKLEEEYYIISNQPDSKILFDNSSILYVLGVGESSLDTNIGKIYFPEKFPVKEIIYSCYQGSSDKVYREFFKKKFGEHVNLKKIQSCEELWGAYKFGFNSNIEPVNDINAYREPKYEPRKNKAQVIERPWE